jgi:kumamolisin
VRTLKSGLLLLLLVLGILPGGAMAQNSAERTALPYPTADTPQAVDRGALKDLAGSTPVSVTVALSLRDLDAAENLLKSLHTPGDPQFHQFLTAEAFVARFAPTEADVAKVIAALAKYGLKAQRTTATTLEVTGTPAAMESAFAVSLHSYEVPAHGNATGYTFHAPLNRPTIPAEISASVSAVVGLDGRPSFHPSYRAAPHQEAKAKPAGGLINPFGFLTVQDFASYYNVGPLYEHGVTGKGRTLAIVTLASFTPSDTFAYWSALGLSVDANRIRIVNVDGGPGAPSDASGSFETTVDVEQSGGIAPGARIIVYQAPNTNQAFLDAFAAAIDANWAESVSTSWGNWEWFFNLENGPVTDPFTGRTVGFTQAVHELLVRAAIQGQTFFAAAGDGGAYDSFDDLGCTALYSPSVQMSCSATLTLDYPASDTLMTSAGGTTLPGLQEYCLNAACTPPFYDVNIPHERVWGWDYLDGLCATLGTPNPIDCGIFPGGGGGGVSIMFDLPRYQAFIDGVELSQPGQVYKANSFYAQFGIGLFYALPPYFRGRNSPDLSFNADPDTGYIVSYTSEPSGVFGEDPFWGGTSFVGPQLNGVTALLGEYLNGKRLGLLNYSLYDLARSGRAYGGPNAPLHAIRYGDNWFYHGRDGYNQGAGLGTMNVANFAEALRYQF